MPAALQNAASELIANGKNEAEVAAWLNDTLKQAALPGMPPDVTQQNVSAWKRSGFRRWEENQRAVKFASRLTNIAESVAPTKPDTADQLAAALIAELAVELAVVKTQYEPGEERTKRLVSIVGALVQLRRTNQAKGWLKVEVAKTKMSMTRLEQETGQINNDLEEEPKPRGGISEEAMKEVNMLMRFTEDDKDYTYEHFSKNDVERLRKEMKPQMDSLFGAPDNVPEAEPEP